LETGAGYRGAAAAETGRPPRRNNPVPSSSSSSSSSHRDYVPASPAPGPPSAQRTAGALRELVRIGATCVDFVPSGSLHRPVVSVVSVPSDIVKLTVDVEFAAGVHGGLGGSGSVRWWEILEVRCREGDRGVDKVVFGNGEHVAFVVRYWFGRGGGGGVAQVCSVEGG